MRYVALLSLCMFLISCEVQSPSPPDGDLNPPADVQDTIPPQITLDPPRQGALYDDGIIIVTQNSLELSGRVTDSAGIQQFVINNTAISLDAEGRFEYLVLLPSDENRLVIQASDTLGNSQGPILYMVFVANKRAAIYARQGLDALQEGEELQAKTALRLALYLDPQHTMAAKLFAQIGVDAQEQLGTESFPYTVRSGDFLSTIAQRYLKDPLFFYILAKHNGIAKSNEITVGQQLRIPKRQDLSVFTAFRPPTPVTEPIELAGAQSPQPVQTVQVGTTVVQLYKDDVPPVQVRTANLEQQGRTPSSLPRPSDTTPPQIALNEPAELRDTKAMQVTQEEVQLVGQVTDSSGLASFLVNETRVEVDETGRFSHRLRLTSPETLLRLTAVDVFGNQSQQVRVIRSISVPQLEYGRYHLLAIGNNEYAHYKSLKTAVADATAVAQVLRDHYGFNVTLLTNASRAEIVSTLDGLRQKLTSKDNLLIYYAGHGILDEEAERGYWLPVDAKPETRTHWLSSADITDTLKAMTVKQAMVVADSCYSGVLLRDPDPQQIRSGVEHEIYLKRLLAKRARIAITAGGLEAVPDGGAGEHSIFTKAFLTVLQDNLAVLESQYFFVQLRPLVLINSPARPYYGDIRFAGHEGGDFLFVRRQ